MCLSALFYRNRRIDFPPRRAALDFQHETYFDDLFRWQVKE
jgi:hypothetical protein